MLARPASYLSSWNLRPSPTHRKGFRETRVQSSEATVFSSCCCRYWSRLPLTCHSSHMAYLNWSDCDFLAVCGCLSLTIIADSCDSSTMAHGLQLALTTHDFTCIYGYVFKLCQYCGPSHMHEAKHVKAASKTGVPCVWLAEDSLKGFTYGRKLFLASPQCLFSQPISTGHYANIS